MISDTLRPKSTQDSSTGGGAARVRDIIRLLIAHGADIATLSKTLSYPIDMAFKKGCEEMVSELSSLIERDNMVYYAEGLFTQDTSCCAARLFSTVSKTALSRERITGACVRNCLNWANTARLKNCLNSESVSQQFLE